MLNFAYSIAEELSGAFVDEPAAMVIAGGTELLNWCRLGIVAPKELVDIGRVEALRGIRREAGKLRIGALTTLNEIGEHPDVIRDAAALAQACLAAASPQIRNRATLGGNVLQKTRCAYFRAEAPLPWPCNKRSPGSGCAARDGLNERHAIFGWTDDCVAVQPSDPLVALVAFDATVELAGPAGQRTLPVRQLHLSQQEAATEAGSGGAAQRETRLRPGELILAYHLPIESAAASAYVKVRERASYEYALVSAAAVVTLDRGRIAEASIALGSVAQRAWPLERAATQLRGRLPTREAILPVLRESLSDARTLAHNGYKIAMAAGAATRAVVEAGRAA